MSEWLQGDHRHRPTEQVCLWNPRGRKQKMMKGEKKNGAEGHGPWGARLRASLNC